VKEKDDNDAPIWLSAEAASGWSSGFNAAKEAVDDLISICEQMLGRPEIMVDLERAGLREGFIVALKKVLEA
jgi:hypothetical protein